MKNFIPGKISSKSFGLINSYAANTNQGIDRNYNDDRVKIIINMNKPDNYINKTQWPIISYFGIFDGHNGDHCAEFLRKNLLQYIYTNPNYPKNIPKAIKEGCINADQDYLQNYSEIYNNNHKGNIPVYEICNNSGSCGLILLLIDTKVYIANVGDSRCLISCQNGKIQKDVTRDHKPEFPYEKQRIYSHGGNIYQNETVFSEEIKLRKNSKNNPTQKNKILLGPFRVNPGKLSVSRTVGDAKAKLEKYGGIPSVIIPEPDVYVFDFYKDDIDYFIMGCDGIFDRIKSYEIFKCVETIVEKEKEMINNNTKYNNCFNTLYDRRINMNTTCGNVVDMILKLSMIRKSYDNVTCIMVSFKDLIFGKNSSNKENNNQDNKLLNSYDKNNTNNTYTRLNKDIPITKNETENKKNENNFIYNNTERKNKLINNENNKENENLSQNKKNQPQSQEKKFRELITLLSINNKKRTNNDSQSILYNTYNSINKEKEKEIENNYINNTQRTIYKNNVLFNSSNLGKNNNSNISIRTINQEKNNKQNQSSTISGDQSTSSKYKRIYNLKRFDVDRKNISKKITNLKMSSYIAENENDSNIKEEKSYLINQSNRIKSNSTENLYSTPNKSEAYNQRITSRKIIRKTHNIFIQKNNSKEDSNNEYDYNNKNQTMYNIRNNISHHVILSGNKKDNKYKSDKEIMNSNNISQNSQVNIRKINYEKYKIKNKKNDNSYVNESTNESKISKYDKFMNSRYEKNIKNSNDNLSGSSSVQIIYTKKRKFK